VAGAPAPAARIKLGAWIAIHVGPAQVERRMNADDDAKGVAMADAKVVRREAPHRDAGQNVSLALGANGIALDHEVPHVLQHEILIRTRPGVEEEAARLFQTAHAIEG